MNTAIAKEMVLKTISLSKNSLNFNPFKDEVRSGMAIHNLLIDMNDILYLMIKGEPEDIYSEAKKILRVVYECLKQEEREENYEFAQILNQVYTQLLHQVANYMVGEDII